MEPSDISILVIDRPKSEPELNDKRTRYLKEEVKALRDVGYSVKEQGTAHNLNKCYHIIIAHPGEISFDKIHQFYLENEGIDLIIYSAFQVATDAVKSGGFEQDPEGVYYKDDATITDLLALVSNLASEK